ncbi:MAG: cell division protein FtsH, partial [Methylocystis sp.]
AEELIFGEDKTTSGAASDIQMATKIARTMITKCGFSGLLGKVAYEPLIPEPYTFDTHSEETRKKIDVEIQNLVDNAFSKAKLILRSNQDELETLARALLRYETLSGDEINKVLAGEDLDKPLVMPADPAIWTEPVETAEESENELRKASVEDMTVLVG